jgi:hypothetical protein
MALWKPFRGNRTGLDSVEKHDGYVYFCVDDGSLFFDYTDADGNLQRKQINAKDAETLMGMSLDEIKNEIATQDTVVLCEAQTYADGGDATTLESAKTYADTAVADAIDALETIATGKADASHTHTIANITDLTATAAELNKLDGVTATTAELNYVDGVTSNIQTQLDGKADASHSHAASDIISGTLSSDILPIVSIAKGGTGATTADAARTNLGAAPAYQYSSTDLIAGTSSLTTGTLYFVYE